MTQMRRMRTLLDDVLCGQLSRREAIRRGALLGLTAPAVLALTGRAKAAVARQTGTPPAASAATPAATGGPPVAPQIPSTREFGGREISDPWAWLENPDDPEVIAYLEAENAWSEQELAPTTDLQNTLYDEFVTRIPQTDASTPVRIDDWFYYTRIEEGQDYEIIARRQGSMDASEEILLDLNAIAGEYLALGSWDPSADHRYFAYELNETGGLEYALYVLDTETGETLPDVIPLMSGFAWANDNATIFYTWPDESLNPVELRTHVLGDDVADDPMLLTEDDPIFGLYLFRTNDRAYLTVTAFSYGSTENQVIDLAGTDFTPTMLTSRQEGIEVYPDHGADGFLLLTNEDAVNFRLMATPDDDVDRASWVDLIPAQDDRLIDGFDVTADHLGVYGRQNGFTQIWIYDVSAGDLSPVPFDEEVYTAGAGTNLMYDATTLQITYTSLVTPNTVFDLDLATGERTLVKQDEVGGGHDPAAYVSERLFAVAEDGTEVPISLVYRADLRTDAPMPLRLDGYGSYGINSDPVFSPLRLSLIERGVVYAIAHVRGGSELGRPWYDDGKLLNKMNTFTDYIACAEHLTNEGITDRILGNGGSAGGLLMGAVANMSPDSFHALVAAVPFVDVLRVMLDPTLPLTTGEYVEWGNPEDDEYYEYILSYSPYDNVTAQGYPNMMLTAGINDDQVPYWQPAKWTAKLRATKTDDNMLVLSTNLGAGHGGNSARDDFYAETAFLYAFMLHHLGRADEPNPSATPAATLAATPAATPVAKAGRQLARQGAGAMARRLNPVAVTGSRRRIDA